MIAPLKYPAQGKPEMARDRLGGGVCRNAHGALLSPQSGRQPPYKIPLDPARLRRERTSVSERTQTTPAIAASCAARDQSRRFDPGAVLRDLADGLARHEVWRAFAWDETQQRYRRSVLGIGWIVLSYMFFVFAIALFFHGFSGMESRQFIIYVAIGYAAFMFLLGNIVDGCAVFRSSATWIHSSPLPYSIYVYKSIARSLFPFALSLAVALAGMLALGWRPHLTAMFALPALGLFLLNAVWMQWLFGMTAARFPDISHLIGAVTRILIFATPVLWVYDATTGAARVGADINPLTHLLEIFRAPLLSGEVPLESWRISIAFTTVGWAAMLLVGGFARRRIPFWV
jgi:ABC-type polysaccharide/polyol phosphate export permease